MYVYSGSYYSFIHLLLACTQTIIIKGFHLLSRTLQIKYATSLTPCGFLLSPRLATQHLSLFDDVDVLKQVHAMTSTVGEPQLRPLLLVRALESGGVFKRDLNGKTTSNEELEEELCGQLLS